MAIGRCMDKEDICNGVLFSCEKDALESVLVRWMNLESVMQRKLGQKEENYHRWAGSSYGAGPHHGLCPQDAMYEGYAYEKFSSALFLMPCFVSHMVSHLR